MGSVGYDTNSETFDDLVVGTKLETRRVYNIQKNGFDVHACLQQQLELDLLGHSAGERHLPSTLMYDEEGLDLWSKVIGLPDYYIPEAEMEALENWGMNLVRKLGPWTALIDLGSGDVRKILGLLQQFEESETEVFYFALDMNAVKLEESMQRIPSSWRFVKPVGICGTFADGRLWSQSLKIPKCFLSLGATVGNDRPERMAKELARWALVMGPSDHMLFGLDGCKDSGAVFAAYNDKTNVWYSFIQNGFLQSNTILGVEWFRPEDWEISGIFVDDPCRHQFTAKALRPVKCTELGLDIQQGEKIVTYTSYKYGPAEMVSYLAQAGIDVCGMWKSQNAQVCKYDGNNFCSLVPLSSSMVQLINLWLTYVTDQYLTTVSSTGGGATMNRPGPTCVSVT